MHQTASARRSLCGVFVVVAFGGGCGTSVPPARPAAKATTKGYVRADLPPDYERIQGTWHVTAVVSGGNPVPANKVADLGLRYVFEGEQVTVHRPSLGDATGRFELGELPARGGGPARNTILMLTTPTVRGLYKFADGKLLMCRNVDPEAEGEYPQDMESRPRPASNLMTLERR